MCCKKMNIRNNKEKFYRYCFVPLCKNTSVTAPDKLFFQVPRNADRLQWCKAVGRVGGSLSEKSSLSCCQDHFNIEQDVENYIASKIMDQYGTKVILRLKKGVVPHIFSLDCMPPKENDLKKCLIPSQNVPKDQENNTLEKTKLLRNKSMRLRNRKAYLANLRCSVPHCNIRPTNEISLHACPNNAAVRNEWAEALRVSYQYVKNMVACSLHFMKIDFIHSNAERVLKHNAVPSRNLPNRKKVVMPVKNKSMKKMVSSNAFERQKKMTDTAVEGLDVQQENIRECRACLAKLDDKRSCCDVFQAWAPPWDGMEATIAVDLAKLANIEISITDRHSKVLCVPCYQRLLDAATFATRVRKADLLLRMRFTAEIDMEKVWPKPIQVDKNINGSVYNNTMDIEIKQEVLSDEEYPVNGTDNSYVESELANLDIKIEPEEFVEPPPMNITINGTISLDPLNSENKDRANGTEMHQETQIIKLLVKQEPMSEGEQDAEQVPDLSLECLLCSKSFNSVTGLKAHVIAQHSYKTVKRKSDGSVSPEKKRCDKHQCAICRRSFQTSTDLMVHETCHNKHACYGCTDKFDSFELLTRHRNRCRASINNSVKKLKTLEDVKRPIPEEKVEYLEVDTLKKESDNINKEDSEMKDVEHRIKDEGTETKEISEIKKSSRMKDVSYKEDGNSEKNQAESVKNEVESTQKDTESGNKEETKEDSASDMKLHLEVLTTKSETESTLGNADIAVETLNNDDCT